MMRFMTVALAVIGVLAFGNGMLTLFARSATGIMESLLLVLIGVVGMGSATVVEAILRVTDHVERGFAEAALARRDRTPQR